MTRMNPNLLKLLILPVFVLLVFCVAGCSEDTTAKKLTPPDNVDWEAIEKGGEEMSEEQTKGE